MVDAVFVPRSACAIDAVPARVPEPSAHVRAGKRNMSCDNCLRLQRVALDAIALAERLLKEQDAIAADIADIADIRKLVAMFEDYNRRLNDGLTSRS